MKKNIYLILIILTGVILILSYSTKKQIYDGDELYSYTLSNSKKHGFMINNIELNKWTNHENIEKVFERNLVAIPLTLDDGSRLKKLFSKICRKTLTN